MQHARCETLGTFADALDAEGLCFKYVRLFEGETVPKEMDGSAALVILGGPMGVYEEGRYPFLRQEIRLIQKALQQERPVFGICLGSQLLAAALGAKVTKGRAREIGWHEVRLTEAAMSDPLWAGMEPSFSAYHWHGDIFELPSGAVSLASSHLTEHQAFRWGRHAYGLLFHIETTEKIIEEMVKTFDDELRAIGMDGLEVIGKAKEHLPRLRGIGRIVFQRWAHFVKLQYT